VFAVYFNRIKYLDNKCAMAQKCAVTIMCKCTFQIRDIIDVLEKCW